MKAFKKILLFVLVLCQLVPLLVSCEYFDFTASPTSKEKEPTYELTLQQLSKYSIVIPEGADSALSELAENVQSFINDIIAIKLPIKKDSEEAQELELYVGKVDRSEITSYYKSFKAEDYGYALVGKKLLLLGNSQTFLTKSAVALKKSLSKLETADEVILLSGEQVLVSGDYELQEMELLGNDICKYEIVFPEFPQFGENEIAGNLRDWILEKTGYRLTCKNDTGEPTDYEIQIGNTAHVTKTMTDEKKASNWTKTDCYYGIDGNQLWIYGSNRINMYTAFTKFKLLFTEQDGKAIFNLKQNSVQPIKSLSLSCMSYNIYYDLNESKRNPDGVISSIKQKNPDVFGLVEVTDAWFKKFENKTTGVTGTYSIVKGQKAENASDGLYNPIFYKTDKYQLLESGTKWLSDTPDKISKLTTSKHYKTLTYAVLKDLSTGIEFLYICVHLDWSDDDTTGKYNPVECRTKQAQVLRNFAKQYNYLPTVIGGDFNASPSSSVIKGMYTNTGFSYAGAIATTKIILPTDINKDYTAIDTSTFDYFFVSNNTITVQKYEAWDNKIGGKYPSDHLPVCADISIAY